MILTDLYLYWKIKFILKKWELKDKWVVFSVIGDNKKRKNKKIIKVNVK